MQQNRLAGAAVALASAVVHHAAVPHQGMVLDGQLGEAVNDTLGGLGGALGQQLLELCFSLPHAAAAAALLRCCAYPDRLIRCSR